MQTNMYSNEVKGNCIEIAIIWSVIISTVFKKKFKKQFKKECKFKCDENLMNPNSYNSYHVCFWCSRQMFPRTTMLDTATEILWSIRIFRTLFQSPNLYEVPKAMKTFSFANFYNICPLSLCKNFLITFIEEKVNFVAVTLFTLFIL